MAAIDKVKVVVVGDSGVGKTSLVHLICHNEPQSNPSATIGCSVEVKLHEYRAGLPNEKTYFVELWDIGGSASHQNSRSIFYNSVNGIILVHDLTNRKSHQNIRKWLAEVLNRDSSQKGNGTYFRYEFDPEQFAGNQIPILVVGSKADLAQSLREDTRTYDKYSSIAEECGADELNLDCMQVKYLAPATTNAVKLTKFFDRTIERRAGNQGHISPNQDRRRFWKNSHVD
ncbi:rab-like protein 3 isoform X3 [Haliotis rufescens]|uniref:rab-like protein 3 isoform X3 n=1 Tax=Haliotis rufescens TaxID=6454 RepID=UPI001EB01BA8|nr:rab-like protein 3 isoform X3 [Haliotis rufescens]